MKEMKIEIEIEIEKNIFVMYLCIIYVCVDMIRGEMRMRMRT